MNEGNKSEVARLMQQIEHEYTAAQRALTAFAEGTARHEFIAHKMENLGACHEKLKTLIGPDKAIELLAQTIWSPAKEKIADE